MSWERVESDIIETGEIWVDPNGHMIDGDDMEGFMEKGSGWLGRGLKTVGDILKKRQGASEVPMANENPLILYQDTPETDPDNKRTEKNPNWGLIAGISGGVAAFIMILILALKK